MVTLERPSPEMGTEDDVVFDRIVAFAVDAIGFTVVWGIIVTVSGAVSDTLGGLVGGLGGVAFFLYFVYFEAEYGQTVGKMLFDIVVVTENGGPVGYRESLVRTLLRIVDTLPFFYIVGLVAIYVTDRNQRVGDLLADTVVVTARPQAAKL